MSDENVGGLVELLPCPFCGGNDLTTFNDGVWCEGCSAHHDIEDSDGGMSAAITAWNRRALSAHGQSVVDERISRAWKLVERWEQPTIDGDTLTKEERLRNMGFAAMLRAALGGNDRG